MGRTIEDIKTAERRMYNPKVDPTERVSKKCAWCEEVCMIPGNFKLCDKCDLAMNDERRKRQKEDKRKKRVEEKERLFALNGRKTTAHYDNASSSAQAGAGVTSSQPTPDEKSAGLVEPKLCVHCNKVELKGNKKYCDAAECQEAKLVHKSELNKERKKEIYYTKKAQRMKEVQERDIFILQSYRDKNKDAMENFTLEEKTNALLSFVAQLTDGEFDLVLMDLLSEDYAERVSVAEEASKKEESDKESVDIVKSDNESVDGSQE